MPKKIKPGARRRPLKRIKLAGSTIAVQRLKEGRYAVVIHRSDGTRSKKEFPTQTAAVTEYDLRCREIERGGVNAATSLSDADRVAVVGFYERTASWTTKPTVAAVLQAFIDRHQRQHATLSFAEALALRMEEAVARGTTPRHIINIRSRVRGFLAEHGETSIADITPDEISAFINSMPVSPRSRADTLNDISGVFAAAVRSGKLERNPAATIRPPKIPAPETGIISAKELARLFAALPERSVAVVAAMSLAGLRRAEAEKLEWSNVRLDDGIIIVTAGTSKTGARRTVPIVPSLARWLAIHRKPEGRVAPTLMTLRRDLEAAVAAAEIDPWPRNCLRHGAASAWVAIEQDIARVAAWLGHAPAVLNRHYKNLLSPAEAQAWLTVSPPSAAGSKVVEFKTAS